MVFRPIQQILGGIEKQPGWQPRQYLLLVLRYWPEVVGTAIAGQTRPLSVRRNVLLVATASSAWAQTLSFERPRILAKLNPFLPTPLQDIQFSTAQWQNSPSPMGMPSPNTERSHPSRLPSEIPPRQPGTQSSDREVAGNEFSGTQPQPDATAAFQRWTQHIQARTQQLPHCPECHCPTPPGELERWSVCSLCAAKRWSI